MIKDFILKNLVLILAVALAAASGVALYYKYQSMQNAYLLSVCNSKNVEKTEAAQKVADTVAENFEKEKVTQNEKFQIFEKQYHTIVEKSPEIHYVDCTDNASLGLLKEVYAARNASEFKDTTTSSGTAK